MKYSYIALATSLVLALSSTAGAADRTIEIAVSKGELLELYGDAFDGLHTLNLNTVKDGTTIALGGVGVKSNVDGDCNVSFSTTNGYKLSHTTITGEVLTNFSLKYNSQVFNNSNTEATSTSCNLSPTALTLHPAPVAEGTNVKAGTYKDTITVTVVVSA